MAYKGLSTRNAVLDIREVIKDILIEALEGTEEIEIAELIERLAKSSGRLKGLRNGTT